MDHEPALISTIAIGLTAAFIGGLIARRLRLPVIVGYIVAGMAVGPFTPGLIADTAIATELAEVGVILLMFGVGIHFSIKDLLAVRAIAIPGAIDAGPDAHPGRRSRRCDRHPQDDPATDGQPVRDACRSFERRVAPDPAGDGRPPERSSAAQPGHLRHPQGRRPLIDRPRRRVGVR